jgi:hypothetical protein
MLASASVRLRGRRMDDSVRALTGGVGFMAIHLINRSGA